MTGYTGNNGNGFSTREEGLEPMKQHNTPSDSYFRALYYPYIEINDPGWLLSAALFWDEISTITPNVKQPYTSPLSRELFDARILTPYRANPRRNEIADISKQISELISNPYFELLIGKDHWSVRQSREYPIHPDKIETNLQYELEELGKARKRPDGFLGMERGLAAAYMLILSSRVAERMKSSIVTDHVEAFRAAEIVRFPQASDQNRFLDYFEVSPATDVARFPRPYRRNRSLDYQRKRHVVRRHVVDACINEMITTWFKINPV